MWLGWMNEYMEGRMDGRKNLLMGKWMNGLLDGWVGGSVDGWMD